MRCVTRHTGNFKNCPEVIHRDSLLCTNYGRLRHAIPNNNSWKTRADSLGIAVPQRMTEPVR